MILPPPTGLGYVDADNGADPLQPTPAITPWGVCLRELGCVCHGGAFFGGLRGKRSEVLMARMVRLSEPSLPSLGRQALNAAGALGRVALAAATGATVLVSDEERARRAAIRQACEHH